MKTNVNIVQDLLDTNKNDKTYIINNKDTNYSSIKFRLIKYVINDNIFVFGTTLLDNKFTIEILKELYRLRWDIEHDLSFKNYHSKTEDQIKQEIRTYICITQLTRILDNIHIENKMQKYNMNFKNNLDKTIKKITKLLLYKNKIKDIICIISIMFFTFN